MLRLTVDPEEENLGCKRPGLEVQQNTKGKAHQFPLSLDQCCRSNPDQHSKLTDHIPSLDWRALGKATQPQAPLGSQLLRGPVQMNQFHLVSFSILLLPKASTVNRG